MGFDIQKVSHKQRWPNLDGKASIEAWRHAKVIEDATNDTAEKDMTDAFGCHGEPIAKAISDTIHRLIDLMPAGQEYEANRIALEGFQRVCDEMTGVRSDLDRLIDKMANEQRQEGFDEAKEQLPGGYDANARDYGVTLDSSLEDAFEAGCNAVSNYLDGMCCESVCVSMDDL